MGKNQRIERKRQKVEMEASLPLKIQQLPLHTSRIQAPCERFEPHSHIYSHCNIVTKSRGCVAAGCMHHSSSEQHFSSPPPWPLPAAAAHGGGAAWSESTPH